MGKTNAPRTVPLATAPTGAQTRELPETLRAQLQSKLGRDFSNVRVHTGGGAAQACQSMQAKAFVYGSDLFFASDMDTAGAHLLGHELAHVFQQARSRTGPAMATILKK
jgi:hypothetical protein